MRLFEFGDLPWVPMTYQICLREYLVFFYKLFGYYKLWIPGFSEFIRKTSADKYMECCSGTGATIQLIDSCLVGDEFQKISYLLSDIQIHPEFVETINAAENSRFHYLSEPVDATKAQNEFNYPKVFINSFHHFTPTQAREILKTNFEHDNEVIILEYVRNSPLGYMGMLLGPIALLLTLPFVIKPKHLPVAALLTYVIPAFPFMFLWDGIVSCMREYSAKQLQSIIDEFDVSVEMTNEIKRNMIYPAGVSVIYFTFLDKD